MNMLLFLMALFTLYYLTVAIVQVGLSRYITTVYGNACDILAFADVPNFAIATKTINGPFTFETIKLTTKTCGYQYLGGTSWTIKYRPIVGDHIHMGIAISINDKQFIMRDRNMTEPVPYEDFHPIPACISPPKYAYVKEWYHTGVHTHCDGIVHIHPWSAPKKLRVEGKDVTLKMWFESVGIEVASTTNMLRIPGQNYMGHWKLEYYVNVTDTKPSFTTMNVETMSNLWLVDHHAFIKLYIGNAPDTNKRVLNYYSKSKIGSEYPGRF